MGKEYNLRCQNFNREAALQFVQRRFRIVRQDESLIQLALQDIPLHSAPASTDSAWTPVILAFEPDGFYLCDNLTSPAESALIFKQLVEFLLLTNDEIRITEL